MNRSHRFGDGGRPGEKRGLFFVDSVEQPGGGGRGGAHDAVH